MTQLMTPWFNKGALIPIPEMTRVGINPNTVAHCIILVRENETNLPTRQPHNTLTDASADLAICWTLEAYMALLAASVPTFKPVVRRKGNQTNTQNIYRLCLRFAT
ncbi:uncharacterized protein CC84DRAFT_1166978, partial [Paraphaeosphaeria sporulosa]